MKVSGRPMSSIPTSAPANVLVVEDEMVLRMRAVDIVEDAGFTAIEAINAEQALSILESRSDISLLFSDIQMPGSMDGLKLAHAVHNRWPLIKIILVSGQEIVGAGALKIIPKAAIPHVVDVLENGQPTGEPAPPRPEEFLLAEIDSLRLLLDQADIDAKALLVQAGIDARERETA